MKKTFPILLITLSLLTLVSLWLFPIHTPILTTSTLLFSLAFALHAIFQKHIGTENSKAKISKETIQYVITLLLISFLAGLAGLFVNAKVSPIYGVGIGLVCTLLVSFVVGYLVKWGVSKIGFN